MERDIVIGGFYRHFKDKLYQVKCVAYHSETKEKLVVYQGLYGDYSVYVRPYDMFLSEVDHVKYPDVTQRYRFELLDIHTGELLEECASCPDRRQGVKEEAESLYEADQRKLERFLDAKSYKEKLDVLTFLRSQLTDKDIEMMAESVDTAILSGSIDEKYDSLRKCLLAHMKYEERDRR